MLACELVIYCYCYDYYYYDYYCFEDISNYYYYECFLRAPYSPDFGWFMIDSDCRTVRFISLMLDCCNNGTLLPWNYCSKSSAKLLLLRFPYLVNRIIDPCDIFLFPCDEAVEGKSVPIDPNLMLACELLRKNPDAVLFPLNEGEANESFDGTLVNKSLRYIFQKQYLSLCKNWNL